MHSECASDAALQVDALLSQIVTGGVLRMRELSTAIKQYNPRQLKETLSAVRARRNLPDDAVEAGLREGARVPVRDVFCTQQIADTAAAEVADAFSTSVGSAGAPLGTYSIADITLAREDMRRMGGTHDNGMLRDEVINVCLALLRRRNRLLHNKKGVPRVHFFSTTFFPKLKAAGANSDYMGTGSRALQRTSDVDYTSVLDCALLFVPVHHPDGVGHWTAAIIDVPGATIFYADSLHGDDTQACLAALSNWLQAEARRSAKPPPPKVRLVEKPLGVPTQTDSCSCGVFMLALAAHLAVGARFDFGQDDIGTFRHRIAAYLLLNRDPSSGGGSGA